VDLILLVDIMLIVCVVLSLAASYIIVYRPILDALDAQTSQCR
jgi:hypothetical protein